MTDIQDAIREHQEFLAEMSRKHEAAIAAAHAELHKLIEQEESPKPESAWIQQNDEKFLLMNEAAVAHIENTFSQLREVIEGLYDREKRARRSNGK